MRKCSMLISEYAPCGELFEYLMFAGTGTPGLGSLATRTYTHQMMDGLQAIHKKGYLHGNLRPHNILLSENFVLKIADFGFYKYHNHVRSLGKTYFNKNDAKPYQAPELLEGEPYTFKSDLFSIGVLMFTLYCSFLPFHETVDTDWWWKRLSKGIKHLEKSKTYLPHNVKKNKQCTASGIKALRSFWDYHTQKLAIDVEFQELMINMLHPLPENRFNHEQIRNHKWYDEKIMTQKEIAHFMRDRIKKINMGRKQHVAQMIQDRFYENDNKLEQLFDESSLFNVMNQVKY